MGVPLRARVVRKPDFRKAPLQPKELDEALAEAALEVERRAKTLAPVDTGRMRASIEAFKDGPLQHGVAVHTEYAAFVEFGTGRAGGGTDPGPTPSDYVHGPSTGQPSRPFLRPALHEVRAKLLSLLRRR